MLYENDWKTIGADLKTVSWRAKKKYNIILREVFSKDVIYGATMSCYVYMILCC